MMAEKIIDETAKVLNETVNRTVQQSSVSFRAGTGNEVKLYFDTVEELQSKLAAMADETQTIKGDIERIREYLQEIKK